MFVGGAAAAQSTEQEDCTLRVFFENGVHITNQRQNTEIVEFVDGSSKENFVVRGFASNVGDADYNLRLSARRATRVGNVVETQGFGFEIVPFGESGPGAEARRAELYRDDCAAAVLSQNGGSLQTAGGSVNPNVIGAGLLGLVLLGLANGGSSSTSDTQ
mgnify:CR=1 FL=1